MQFSFFSVQHWRLFSEYAQFLAREVEQTRLRNSASTKLSARRRTAGSQEWTVSFLPLELVGGVGPRAGDTAFLDGVERCNQLV